MPPRQLSSFVIEPLVKIAPISKQNLHKNLKAQPSDDLVQDAPPSVRLVPVADGQEGLHHGPPRLYHIRLHQEQQIFVQDHVSSAMDAQHMFCAACFLLCRSKKGPLQTLNEAHQ